MRTLICTSLLCIATLLPNSSTADDRLRKIEVLKSPKPRVSQAEETYRGYETRLSAILSRQDFNEFRIALKQQLDIVESVGLSPRVLSFFHSVPIVADEFACLVNDPAVACYERPGTPTFGAYAARAYDGGDVNKVRGSSDRTYFTSDSGFVMVRPLLLPEKQNPVLLHEFLHAFHAQMMPQGFRNEGILFHYNLAKSKQLYPEDSYLMKNEREFFAVTASIFLYGRDRAHEPFMRSNLKEKQPDYFKYLVKLFELDPDQAPNASPVASAF